MSGSASVAWRKASRRAPISSAEGTSTARARSALLTGATASYWASSALTTAATSGCPAASASISARLMLAAASRSPTGRARPVDSETAASSAAAPAG